MATDFTYGGKQIVTGGPIKPNGKDMPSDARTRVDCYADIATIPNPYVGLRITVKVDETNNNKMTDYKVKSLKANSIGLANSLIDEVEKYVDYLGVSAGESSSAGLTNIQDFYNSPKNGKKIVMIGDSTVISGAGGGPISARFAKYQEPGNCLEGCTVENQGAIGKTLNAWINREMSNVISNSSDVDLYIFCLGINDLMNDKKTE